MFLLLLSFLAGVLTVLAPCVLPLLPIIIGGSLDSTKKYKPYIIISGLVLSITAFTILLKASTVFLDIDPLFWKLVSGLILVVFGLIYLFPSVWDKFSLQLGLANKSDKLLQQAKQKQGWVGDILLGAALGPVFASCSPTYALIIATILPVDFWQGLIYIVFYAMGLAAIMLAIALLGRIVVQKVKIFSNPNGWFKKGLGVIFILVGVFVITGLDKVVETRVLDAGVFDVTRFEQQILDKNSDKISFMQSTEKNSLNQTVLKKAPEIKNIQTWINADSQSLESLKGKVVLVDFWTYSCINCQRTLPYVTKWYDTYKDQGLVVLGIHAPEFAYEQKLENVQTAVQEAGIHYPVGLDNSFSTWAAYDNHFWPAFYLVDKQGNIRRTHFGEGEYAEMEQAIQLLLKE